MHHFQFSCFLCWRFLPVLSHFSSLVTVTWFFYLLGSCKKKKTCWYRNFTEKNGAPVVHQNPPVAPVRTALHCIAQHCTAPHLSRYQKSGKSCARLICSRIFFLLEFFNFDLLTSFAHQGAEHGRSMVKRIIGKKVGCWNTGNVTEFKLWLWALQRCSILRIRKETK